MCALRDARTYNAGYTGLVGSVVVPPLRQKGYSNILRRNHAELDLADSGAVERFFAEERPDYVVLAAGKVAGIAENQQRPADLMRANLAIQSSVMDAANRSSMSKLLFFGSSCMYPRKCPQPMAVTVLWSGTPEPTSLPYATAKMTGVHMCHAYNRQNGLNRFIPLIPNSVYGPHDNFYPDRSHVLSALIGKFHAAVVNGESVVRLWGSGNPRREFIHADDLANACLMLLKSDVSAESLPLNIGSGSGLSIGDLAVSITKVLGYKGSIEWENTKSDGSPRKLLDSTRIGELGWQPSIQLEAGLSGTYQWVSGSHLQSGLGQEGHIVSYTNVLIKKPWGHEYLCYQNEVLAIWFLHIEKDQRTSLHCHPNKHTGYVVLEGVAELSFLRGKMRLEGLDKVHIFRSRFHSTHAVSDQGAFILEIETPEDKHDLVRLEDAYGRKGKAYEGKEFEFPKEADALWIGEPGELQSVNEFKGCRIKHFLPQSKEVLLDYVEQDFLVVTRGGVQAYQGAQILWPGDVIDGVSLRRLVTAFELILGTTLLHITQLSTDAV